jgi:hypothetical protein
VKNRGGGGNLSSFTQLPPELRDLYSMLRGLPRADENHRNVPPIALFQKRIFIDVDFAQRRAELRQQRSNGSSGFVAQMAARAGIECHVVRAGGREPLIFAKIWAKIWAKGVAGMFAHGFGFEYFWKGPECGWNACAR